MYPLLIILFLYIFHFYFMCNIIDEHNMELGIIMFSLRIYNLRMGWLNRGVVILGLIWVECIL
jgi:hypothetical protein